MLTGRLWSYLTSAFWRTWIHVPCSVRLWVYRRLLSIGLRLYGTAPSIGTRTFRLPLNLYAKTGSDILEAEAEAMKFIARCTKIPLPIVLDSIQLPRGIFILMTRLPGKPLRSGLETMTLEEQLTLAQDLRRCFQQLHEITAPSRCISGIGGGPLRDFRITYDHIGPFPSETEFYEFLFQTCPLEDHPRLRELSRDVHSTSHRLCFTHCDIGPQNILVQDNKLSGIVDWECSAWLPEWWEYTRSIYSAPRYPEWVSLMNNAHLTKFPRELELESAFWQVNSPW